MLINVIRSWIVRWYYKHYSQQARYHEDVGNKCMNERRYHTGWLELGLAEDYKLKAEALYQQFLSLRGRPI